MALLVIGLALFFSPHLIPTQPHIRHALVDRWGLNIYKGAFSVASLIGLGLIIVAFSEVRYLSSNIQLWNPPVWTRHLAFLIMLPAMVLLVAAYVPSRLRTAAKHPMLVAIKLWALGHLLANGDLAAVLLFGSFLAYAVFDRISLKRRSVGPPPNLSNGITNDVLVVVLGVVLFVFMLTIGHARLIGVPLLPGWA